jgi:hypothetical protein
VARDQITHRGAGTPRKNHRYRRAASIR